MIYFEYETDLLKVKQKKYNDNRFFNYFNNLLLTFRQ